MTKIFDPYIVNDQRGQAQRARGQWTEILFFAIFRTFAMDRTLLRLIFIQNVKKGKKQPTLLYILYIALCEVV